MVLINKHNYQLPNNFMIINNKHNFENKINIIIWDSVLIVILFPEYLGKIFQPEVNLIS